MLDASNLLEDAALDRYEFIRDGYLQRRSSKVLDTDKAQTRAEKVQEKLDKVQEKVQEKLQEKFGVKKTQNPDDHTPEQQDSAPNNPPAPAPVSPSAPVSPPAVSSEPVQK